MLIALFWSMPTACSSGVPVERGEWLVIDRARLDVPRPANNAGNAMAALPDLALQPLERRDAAIGKADSLCPLSAVKTTLLLSSCPTSSSFFGT